MVQPFCQPYIHRESIHRNLRVIGSSMSVEEVDWVNLGLFLFTGGSE